MGCVEYARVSQNLGWKRDFICGLRNDYLAISCNCLLVLQRRILMFLFSAKELGTIEQIENFIS
jgi:hypothetical protein